MRPATGRRAHRSIACLLAIAALAPATAAGQGVDRPPPDEFRGPLLGGHVFSPVQGVPSPFIRTELDMRLGIGKAYDLEVPIAIIDGDTLTALRGDLLFAVLSVGYQHAIKDWMAVRGRFDVTGRLGTGTGALLATGVTAVTSFELGWLFKLMEHETTLLSLDLGVDNNSFTGVNLLKFIEDVIAGDPRAELVRTTPSVRGFGGARFAWAISDVFGFTGAGQVGYGESVNDVSTSEWYYGIGGLIDADLGARTQVPMSFALGYSADSFPIVDEQGEGGKGTVHGFIFRIGYTGRDDLALGLTFTFDSTPTPFSDQRLKFGSTALSLRYYF